MTATVTIDLEAAGLTHARGKSDKCAGRHDVDMLSVVSLDSPGWVEAGPLLDVVQALHAQAHPDGTASWGSCREQACSDAWELIYGER